MLDGTRKLFPNEYEKFKEAMICAAEEEELPVALQLDETEDLSLNDIRDMFYDFNRDTGLGITGALFLCSDCGKLHFMVQVDYPDEKEERILQ